MRHSIVLNLVITLLVLFVFSACDKKSETSTATESVMSPAQSTMKKEQAHTCPAAQPGSHDDWCAGHQVPESQCLICNPDLRIERPPKSSEVTP